MNLKKFFLMMIVGLIFIPQSQSSSQGNISLESRTFVNDNNLDTKDSNFSVISQIEEDFNQRNFYGRAKVTVRVDQVDQKRSYIIPNDIYIGYKWNNFIIEMGTKIVNWSATEAFHPADIINSRNYDSNFENAEKIGELMLHFTILLDNGSLNFYFMPLKTKSILPSTQNRLSPIPSSIQIKEKIVYYDSKGQISDDYGLQWAFLYEQSFSDIDMSLYAVSHQDRIHPIFTFSSLTTMEAVSLPKLQVGMTYQHVLADWIFKLESASIFYPKISALHNLSSLQQKNYSDIAIGLEYDISYQNGSQSMFLLEGQATYGLSKIERENFNIFQRDVLIGHRFSFNDFQSREILMTFIFDVERKNEYIFSLSYAQRINSTWGLKSSLRYINAPIKELQPQGLEVFHEDHQIGLTLTRYF